MSKPNGVNSIEQWETGQIDLLPTEDSLVPVRIQAVDVLGKGRAAEARLVNVTTEDGRSVVCVEKVFCPGLLTRSIYRACFQASFAYQFNSHAILACFYRRRVAWAITRAILPEVDVARPLYVRWDNQTQAMVLASDFIKGRGIQPQSLDTYMMRRSLAERLVDFLPRLQHRLPKLYRWLTTRIPKPPPEEIDELLSVMNRLESLFLESGLVGTGWQVCKRAIVSTANLLKTPKGYVSVDLESGIPSVLVPTYLREGLRLKSFPLFDCIDSDRLRHWLRENRPRLSKSLTNEQLLRLDSDVDLLVEHTKRWKSSEPAVLRNPARLFSGGFYKLYQQRILDQWQRCEILDSKTQHELQQSSRPIVSRLVYWLGWVPGKLGRFFQRCAGNVNTRQQVRLFFQEAEFRGRVILGAFEKQKNRLCQARRLPPNKLETISDFQLQVHWGLSKLMPARVQRIMTDSVYRSNWLVRLVLLFSNNRFQREYGRWVIQQRFQAWQNEQRLTADERMQLNQELEQPAIQEYLQGFGVHLGLKLLLPILLPLKAVGAAASLASGNPLYFVLMFFVLPLLRTATTVWRMLVSGRPMREFRDALIVGALPTVGTLAYPVQMYSTCPRLSAFLLRDFAARLGRLIPIYGGKDSRTEIAAIKSVNLIAESLDLWLQLTGSKNYKVERLSAEQVAAEQVAAEQVAAEQVAAEQVAAGSLNDFDIVSVSDVSSRLTGWDKAAIVQLKLIQSEYWEISSQQQRHQSESAPVEIDARPTSNAAIRQSKAA